MDRKEIIAKLTRAHDEVDSVLESLLNGDQTRISWTRLLAHNVNNHLTSVFYIIERFVQSGLATEEVTTYIDGLKGIAERIQETMQRMMTVAQFDNLVKLAPLKFASVAEDAFEGIDDDLSLSDQITAVFARFYAAFHERAGLARIFLRELVFFSQGKQAEQYLANRRRILQGLERLVADALSGAGGRSVLLITHRPEGLDLVDRIVRLDAVAAV